MIVKVVFVESEREEENIIDGDDRAQRVGVIGRIWQQECLYGSQHLIFNGNQILLYAKHYFWLRMSEQFINVYLDSTLYK